MSAESSSNWIPFFLKSIPSPSHVIDKLMRVSTYVLMDEKHPGGVPRYLVDFFCIEFLILDLGLF